MPEAPLIQFRVMDPLHSQLTERAEPNQGEGLIARRDLERYYQVLADELRAMQLSEAEASLIVDACNGWLIEHWSYRLLHAHVEDAIRFDGLDRKWSVDGRSLVARLRGLSPGAIMAICDACSQFWRDPNPTDEALRRVGLVRAHSDQNEHG